jgi:CBS domain containing-hemolysin-like protein
MIYISYPLVVISEFITKFISKKKISQRISREEVVALVHLGTKEGVLRESESKIINNLIRLKRISVRAIMTPRTVVVSAPEEISLDEFIKEKEYRQYSRIPIYSGNIDNVTGYILNSDILDKLANLTINQKLKELKRPIIVFYENFSIPKLFEELLLKKEHLALIIDEYGGTQGLVTMEDIIESILGIEIMDEKDVEVNMQELAKKKWKIRKRNINIDKN